jgi:hypothetical protein
MMRARVCWGFGHGRKRHGGGGKAAILEPRTPFLGLRGRRNAKGKATRGADEGSGHDISDPGVPFQAGGEIGAAPPPAMGWDQRPDTPLIRIDRVLLLPNAKLAPTTLSMVSALIS